MWRAGTFWGRWLARPFRRFSMAFCTRVPSLRDRSAASAGGDGAFVSEFQEAGSHLAASTRPENVRNASIISD